MKGEEHFLPVLKSRVTEFAEVAVVEALHFKAAIF